MNRIIFATTFILLTSVLTQCSSTTQSTPAQERIMGTCINQQPQSIGIDTDTSDTLIQASFAKNPAINEKKSRCCSKNSCNKGWMHCRIGWLAFFGATPSNITPTPRGYLQKRKEEEDDNGPSNCCSEENLRGGCMYCWLGCLACCGASVECLERASRNRQPRT